MREDRMNNLPQWADEEKPQTSRKNILMVDEATDTSLDEEAFKVVSCGCRLSDNDSDTSCEQKKRSLGYEPTVTLRECYCVLERGRTLLDAVCTGNFELLELCLDAEVDTNSRDENGNTAVQMVSERGDLDMLAFLLTLKNIDVNARNSQGLTALSLAVMNARDAAAIMLLEHGADPNIADNLGRTSIFFSVLRGNVPMTQKLIEHKADVNVVDVFGNTPISTALIETPLITMVRVLLSSGANPLQKTNRMNPFLETVLACSSDERLKLVKTLVESGVDINVTEPYSRRNCLHMNAINGFLPLGQYLVNSGADLEQTDISGRTPAVAARQHGNKALEDFFLKSMCLKRIIYKERLKRTARSFRRLTLSTMFPSSMHLLHKR